MKAYIIELVPAPGTTVPPIVLTSQDSQQLKDVADHVNQLKSFRHPQKLNLFVFGLSYKSIRFFLIEVKCLTIPQQKYNSV